MSPQETLQIAAEAAGYLYARGEFMPPAAFLAPYKHGSEWRRIAEAAFADGMRRANATAFGRLRREVHHLRLVGRAS